MTHTDLMIRRLKTMDEKQLLELFYDMDDLEAVERIADCADHFVNREIGISVKEYLDKKSEEEDWKELDDAQRLRDIK